MEEKKYSGRGGDRRSGTITKTKLMFGYKYTPKEYQEMRSALEKMKVETKKTTSRLIYELLTGKG